MRTRGDEVARENITQKEKKKKKISTLSAAHLPLRLFLFLHPSQQRSLSSISTAVCRADRGGRERERGRKRDGERDGGEVEERNERVVTGSVCV